jgi:hypothetical protein
MTGGETVDVAVPAVIARLLSGLTCPPTDLYGLCDRLNVSGIDEDENLPVVGELRRAGKAFRIVCAANQSPVRRRFTIAHELGHAVLESTGPRAPRVGSELERLCDRLAAEILMPLVTFRSALGDRPAVASTIRELASQFQTSLSAAAIRCSELRPISVLEIQRGRIRWFRGRAKPGHHQLDDVMRQAFDGEPGDGLVFIGDGARATAYSTEWLRMSSERSGLLVMIPHDGSGA